MTDLTKIVLEGCIVDINEIIAANNGYEITMSTREEITRLITLKKRFEQLIIFETKYSGEEANALKNLKINEEV